MKRVSILIAVALAVLWLTAVAQTQIYESKDKSGAPVFSDQPTAGSKEVTLPKPNVSDAPLPSVQPQAPASIPYSQLSIVSPTADGTIHSNTGEFNVSVSLDPALNTSRGDRFVVKLDGIALPTRYTSTTMDIRPEEVAGSAVADNIQHQLDVAVIDANGKILIAANPVTFYLRHATVERRRHR